MYHDKKCVALCTFTELSFSFTHNNAPGLEQSYATLGDHEPRMLVTDPMVGLNWHDQATTIFPYSLEHYIPTEKFVMVRLSGDYDVQIEGWKWIKRHRKYAGDTIIQDLYDD